MKIDDLMPGHELDLMVARLPALDPRHLPTDFAPSKNGAHAWLVAERLRLMVFPNKTGWAAAMVRYDTTGEGPQHGEHWIDDSLDHYATAPTPALAICRAALKAKGAK